MTSKPLFQHRHYCKMAEMIDGLAYELGYEHDEIQRSAVAKYFAAKLKESNPQFSATRFVAAAMGKPLTRRDKSR